MTLRKWSYFRRSEDLTEPLHIRIFLFFSLLFSSFLYRNIIETRIYQRFTLKGGKENNIVIYIIGMREWKEEISIDVFEWSFTRLGFASFFLSLQEGRPSKIPGRPIQTDSTASGIPRHSERNGEEEREREHSVFRALSEKRSRSFRSALSKRFHCI